MQERHRPLHHLLSPAVVRVVRAVPVVLEVIVLPKATRQRKVSRFSTEQRLVLVLFREVDECYISKYRI